MAKKEYVKITPEGLHLATILGYNSLTDICGFYSKEVFFTEGFQGNKSFLYQALGNLGAYARDYEFEKDISIVIISDIVIENYFEKKEHSFVDELENKLNQNSSPYRRMKFMSESQLLAYLERRAKINEDEQMYGFLKGYKQSIDNNNQGKLF